MKLAEMYGMPKMTAQDLELLQAIKLRWNDSADRIHKAFPSQPPSYVAPRGIMSSVALDDVKPSSSIVRMGLKMKWSGSLARPVYVCLTNSFLKDFTWLSGDVGAIFLLDVEFDSWKGIEDLKSLKTIYIGPGVLSGLGSDGKKHLLKELFKMKLENVRLEPLNKTKILKQVCDIFNNSKTLLQFQSALIDHDLEEWF
jgi:hypothetical protein